MTDATIHLRVPAPTKGRWIRASRARGMRLSDWIKEAVESHMQKQSATITIPGARDAVQDDLIGEVVAEEQSGQRFSLPPGVGQ